MSRVHAAPRKPRTKHCILYQHKAMCSTASEGLFHVDSVVVFEFAAERGIHEVLGSLSPWTLSEEMIPPRGAIGSDMSL